MKKLFLFLVMTVALFTLVGKVSAGYSYSAIKDDTYSGENVKYLTALRTDSLYTAGTTITIIITEKYGVTGHTLENMFDTTKFQITQAESKVGSDPDKYRVVLTTLVDLPAGSYPLFGIYAIKDITSPDNCKLSFALALNETPKTCADSRPDQGLYYNDNGEPIDADRFKYDCEPPMCSPVTFTINGVSETHYFNMKAEEVSTKEEMIASCDCQTDGQGWYVKWDTETDQPVTMTREEFEFECTPRACTSYDYNNKTYYYDINGKLVDSEEEMLKSCQCRHDSINGKYYDNENKEITEEEFKELCECRIDKDKDPKEYFCKKGEPCSEEEYKNQCPENSPTGSSIPYIAIIGGVILAGGCYLVSRKHSKLKNI